MKFKAHCLSAWGWLLALALGYLAPMVSSAAAAEPCCIGLGAGSHLHSVGPGGGTASASKDGGVDYIFVVDTTGSMTNRVAGSRKTRWDELHPRLVENVRRLQPERGDRLHLLVFADRISPGLAWTPAGSEPVTIPVSSSAAFVFSPRTEAEKAAMVLSVETMKRPNGSTTALRDALRMGFERALALQAQGSGKILVAVFSDGEDNGSTTSVEQLSRFVESAAGRLGRTLVNETYLFIRVAGLNIPPPTTTRGQRVDETPLFASVRLGPSSLETTSLAAQESGTPVSVDFQLDGLTGSALPIYFEPAAGAPRVRVVCSCGKPPVWGQSGRYNLVFQRVGPPDSYMKSFEGRLKVDTRGGAVPNLVLNNLSSDGIRIVFPGAQSEPIPPESIKPVAGQRVLLGSTIQFEAPSRAGAKYAWTFRGADAATSTQASFSRVMAKAGRVDIDLRVEQPGVVVPPVALWLEVVDPAIKLTASPSAPVEGEPIAVMLASGNGVKVEAVQWLPLPRASTEGSATYFFDRVGTAKVSAIVTTDLGPAAAELAISVSPGLTAPVLVSPAAQTDAQGIERVQMHRTSDLQPLVAVAGEGTARVRFVLTQNGKSLLDAEAPATLVEGRREARLQVSGAEFKAGPAVLTLYALPKDPSVLRRVGERKAEYQVTVNPSGVSIVKLEPSSAEIEWGRPISFLARLEGPGMRKVAAVDWMVTVVGRDNSRTTLPGRTQPAAEWVVAPDALSAVSQFEFTPDPANPRLASLRTDASLEIEARPQGDPVVVEGARALWAGLSPKFAPARFVIELPRQVDLDQKLKVRVTDEFGSARAASVRWELVGETADPLRGQSGSEQEFVPQQPGPHTVRAVVEWAGGTQVCPEASFYVDYEPLALSVLTWKGGSRPVIEATAEAETSTILIKGSLRGTRAAGKINVVDPRAIRPDASLPGFPRVVSAVELAKGIAVPFPAVVSWSGTGRHEVSMEFSGLDALGQAISGVERRGFKIINHPSRWPYQVIVVVILLTLGYFTSRLFSGNDNRFYQIRILPDRDDRGSENRRIARTMRFLQDRVEEEGERAWENPGDKSFLEFFTEACRKDDPKAKVADELGSSPARVLSDSFTFSSRRNKKIAIPLAELLPYSRLDGWPEWTQFDDSKAPYLSWRMDKGLFSPKIYAGKGIGKSETNLEIKMMDADYPTGFPMKGLGSARLAEIRQRDDPNNILHVVMWDITSTEGAEAEMAFDRKVRRIVWGAVFLAGVACHYFLSYYHD